MSVRNSAIFALLACGLLALSGCPKPEAGDSHVDVGAVPAATQHADAANKDASSSPQDVKGNAPPVVIPAGLTESSFAVEGMHCADCSTSIEKAVIALPGVSTVAADWKNGTVKVQYDATKCKADDIIAAVDKLAFKCKLADAPQGSAGQPAQGA